MNVLNRFTFAFFILFFNFSVFAQVGSIKVILSVNKDLKGNLDKIHISGYLAKGAGKVIEDPSPRYFDFKSGKMEYKIDSLPFGTYCLVISGRYHRSNGRFLDSYYLGNQKWANVTVKDRKTEVVKIVYPNDCIYHKHLALKVCPKCKKGDRVIAIGYGCPVIDPTEASTPEYHSSMREETGCDPTWYCNRDRLEF